MKSIRGRVKVQESSTVTKKCPRCLNTFKTDNPGLDVYCIRCSFVVSGQRNLFPRKVNNASVRVTEKAYAAIETPTKEKRHIESVTLSARGFFGVAVVTAMYILWLLLVAVR